MSSYFSINPWTEPIIDEASVKLLTDVKPQSILRAKEMYSKIVFKREIFVIIDFFRLKTNEI